MPKIKSRETTQVRVVPDEQKKKAIEEAAYYRWLNRGGGNGGETEDWLDAEQKLMRNVFDRSSEN